MSSWWPVGSRCAAEEAKRVGEPPKLRSQFGTTYTMLLNLARHERMKYASMVASSFLMGSTKRADGRLNQREVADGSAASQ